MRFKHLTPFAVVSVVALILAIVIQGQFLDLYNRLEILPTTLHLKKVTPPPAPAAVEAPKTISTPASFLIDVPFTTQAPFSLWDPLHEEACEEASLLMVYYYRTGQKFSTPLEADTELNKVISWEGLHGYSVDLTAKELAEVASGYLKLETGRVIANPTIEQIKTEIAAGRPVIVPAAGRELKNPNFTPPGPVYHMLVIKGYDKDGFIVNDPGTRNGESYRYTFDRIMTAMHSWDPDNILNGPKSVIVFD